MSVADTSKGADKTIFEQVLVLKLRDTTPFVSYRFPPEVDSGSTDFNFVLEFCFPEVQQPLPFTTYQSYMLNNQKINLS